MAKAPAGKNKPGSSGGAGVVDPIPGDDPFEPPQEGSTSNTGGNKGSAAKKKPGSSRGTGVVDPIPGDDPFEPPKG